MFTDKSSTFLNDQETVLWVLGYTERVVRVFVAFMLAVYNEYRLSYIPTDFIAFTRELGFALEVALGSRANGREVLELLDVIEATN